MAIFNDSDLNILWDRLIAATEKICGITYSGYLDDNGDYIKYAGIDTIHNDLLSHYGIPRETNPTTIGGYLRGISVMATYHKSGTFNKNSDPLSFEEIVDYLEYECEHLTQDTICEYINSTSHKVTTVCADCGAELETYSEDHRDWHSPACRCWAMPCAAWHGECGPECSGRYYMTQEDADNCDYCTSTPTPNYWDCECGRTDIAVGYSCPKCGCDYDTGCNEDANYHKVECPGCNNYFLPEELTNGYCTDCTPSCEHPSEYLEDIDRALRCTLCGAEIPYSCPYCDKTVGHRDELSHHEENTGKYRCYRCDEVKPCGEWDWSDPYHEVYICGECWNLY